VTWSPGEVIADYYSLPVPLDIPPGRYVIYTGLYDANTGERLPVVMEGGGQPHDRLDVCEITVHPLVPLWTKAFDAVWLGVLLVGLVLPAAKKHGLEEQIDA
jgi:hypothetical protein